jgi:hypothetical protein
LGDPQPKIAMEASIKAKIPSSDVSFLFTARSCFGIPIAARFWWIRVPIEWDRRSPAYTARDARGFHLWPLHGCPVSQKETEQRGS